MKIQIAARLRPFSQKPGTQVIIPGGSCVAVIYPTYLKIIKEGKTLSKLRFCLNEATKDFTVIQDLEKRCVRVFFRAKEGYFRYQLKHVDSKVIFSLEKASDQLSLDLYEENENPIRISLKPKETLDFEVQDIAFVEKAVERLSFGCHKKQDWQLVQSRNNPIEYLPFWFYLGQITPSCSNSNKRGSLEYLTGVEDLLNNQRKEEALKKLSNIFKAGFKELLIPLLYDEKHHGVFESKSEENFLAPSLLSSGYKIIRNFFLRKEDATLFILPNLPKDFHSGRLVGLKEDGLIIDIEWSKKILKKMKVKVARSQDVRFSFQKPLKSFRIKSTKTEAGRLLNTRELLELEEGKTYLFDNFKK